MNLSEVEGLKEHACNLIDQNAETLVSVSHDIHDHPEQNYEEVFASDLLTRTANGLGVPVELGAFDCATGFSGDVGSGPTVCIMSEYDALPDIGHGCGHNMFGAASLGAAVSIKELIASGKLKGTIRFYGTPAEEDLARAAGHRGPQFRAGDPRP